MKKLLLLIGIVSLLCFQTTHAQTYDYLKSATATGNGTTTNSSTAWTNVVSVTIDVTNVSYVMLTASINMRPDGDHTNGREANYNIYRSDLTTDESGVIKRQILRNSETGVESWGIGTLVHIFDVGSLSGNKTYTLEHSNQGGSNAGRNVYSSARLTAVALTTATNQYQLSNDVIRLGATGSTTTSITYDAVANTTTDAITLPIKGDIFVIASINGKANASGSVAEYKLESSTDGGSTWADLGKAVKRSMANSYDDGIVSLTCVLQDQEADNDFKFRIAHRRVSGGATITTHYCNIVAVALAHSGGGYFPSFCSKVDDTGVDVDWGDSYELVTSSTFTAAADISSTGTSLFVSSQYLVDATNLQTSTTPDERMRAGNQLFVNDGTTTTSAEEYYRYISDNSNFGAGGFIGLMTNLEDEGSYTIGMNHIVKYVSNHTDPKNEILTTSNVILTGFQTYDQPSYNWDGSTDTDWATAANWSSTDVPGSTDNVHIPSGLSNYPIIDEAAACYNMDVFGSLTIGTSGDLDVNTNGCLSIFEGGAVTVNAGTLDVGDLQLNWNLTESANSLTISGGTTTVDNDLSIYNSNSTLTVSGGDLDVTADLDYEYGTITLSGGTVDVGGYIDSYGTGSLTVESTSSGTGSLIVEGTAYGDITVERYLTQGKWHYISEPVNDTRNFNASSFLNLTSGANHDQLYWWDENGTDAGATGIWFDILNGSEYSTGSFQSSQGYAITYEGTGNETINFSGVPYVANQSIDITRTAASSVEGANLVGNPFCSTIAANNNASTTSFLSTNIALLATSFANIYLWDEQASYQGNRDDYATISNSEIARYIAVGQAFMVVKKDLGTTALPFNINMRKHGTPTFYKDAKQDEVPRFYMSVENDEGLYNEILIAFIDGMTKGLDPSYDAGKLKGNPNIALYTKLVEDNGIDFAHQALPPLDDEVVRVKTGLDVSTAGNYTFKINELQNFDEAISIKLEDKLTGSLIDFRQDGEYSFFINTPGEIRERFVLHFNGVTGIEDDEHITKATVQTYGFNNTLYILNPEMKQGTVTIYNLTGQKVAAFKLTGDTKQQQTLNMINIINIVKIQTGDGVLSQKVIFR